MRVAFCQPSSRKVSFSGPERQTVQIGKALRARGYEVLIGVLLVSPSESAQDTTLGKLALASGLEVYPLPLLRKYNLFASVHAFRQFVRKHRPDVVCVAGYKAGIISALARCVPSVAVTRGWTAQDSKVRLYEWMERRLLKRHSAVITVSRQQREEVLQLHVPAEKVCYVPNGIDLQNLEPAYTSQQLHATLGIDLNLRLLGIVGRLSVEKGHEYGLHAFRLLLETGTQARLLVVGDGTQSAFLQAQVKDLHIEHAVHFLGERADARQIIGALDLMILPSLTEGTPNVVLEAFAYKTPVVATAVGGVPELVRNSEMGWLVPPRDPHALAQAIREALSNPEEARRRAENAYRHLLANFTVEKQVDKWEQAIQAAVENWRIKRR